MNANDAKAILDSVDARQEYVCYQGGNPAEVTLDGRFTDDELEAIAWWMRNAGEGKA